MLTSSAPGNTQDIIQSITFEQIPGGFILDILVWGPYRNRYLGIFRDGIYLGNHYCDLSGSVRLTIPFGRDQDFGHVYIEDCGDWAFLEGDQVPSESALLFEADVADKLTFKWESSYRLAPTYGDSQLTAISVSGAVRNFNCALSPEMPTRAKLTYTIETVGATRIVKWWNRGQLVARGSRIGNGLVECTEENSSGLTIRSLLAYTADIPSETAFLEIRWPAYYQIHYLAEDSTEGFLSFPREPEALVGDNGGNAFVFQIQEHLPSGVYHTAIVPVDDEGNELAYPTELEDSPKIIRHPPAAPDITNVQAGLSTNYLKWSQDLTHAPWTAAGATVTANQAIAPDGTLTADKVHINLGNTTGTEYVYSGTTAGLANGTYCNSIWIKGTLGQKIYFLEYADSYLPSYVQEITFTGEWQRISNHHTITGGEYDFVFTTFSRTFTNDVRPALPAVDFYAWGGLINPGTTPGLYIKTEGTAITTPTSVVAITWSTGEPDCSYDLYKSGNNTPVDLYHPIHTTEDVGDVSEITAYFTGVFDSTPLDRETPYDGLINTFDANLDILANAYLISPSLFIEALESVKDNLHGDLLDFVKFANLDIGPIIGGVMDQFSNVINLAHEFYDHTDVPTIDDFQDYIHSAYVDLLAYLGNILMGQPGRFIVPDGTDEDVSVAPMAFSISAAVTPLMLPARYGLIVRASQGTVQEQADHQYNFTFTEDNVAVVSFPPAANIDRITITNSFDMSVAVSTITDDHSLEPQFFDLYVVAHGVAIDLDSPVDSVEVGTIRAGLARATLTYTVPGTGEYDIAVLCRSENSTDVDVRSEVYFVKTHYISSDSPNRITNGEANVMGGEPPIIG